MNDELPEGWAQSTLGEILSLEYGKSLPKSSRHAGEFPVFGSNGVVGYHSHFLQKGPGIIVGRKGSHGEVTWTNDNFFPIDTTYFVSVKEGIDFKLVYYLLKSLDLKSLNRSTAIPGLNREDAYNLPIKLPPLPEQQRIVAKLDELMEKVDRSRARLERIPKILKRFRQSVLSAAIRGSLTEAWRANHKTVFELNLSEIERNENDWLVMKAMDACTEVASGSTPPNNPFTKTGDIPFLKVYNIVDQKINFNYKPQFVSRKLHETKLKRCRLFPNDVIINIVGPPLGKVALVTDQFPEWNMNQALVLFRPKKFLTSKFLYYILNEGSEIRRLESEYRGSAGQTNISLTQCRSFIFEIPSLKEQEEIIKKVEAYFAFADRIEWRYNQAKTQLDKLPQSLLSVAFEGKLVAQNGNDEPAGVLLKRINVLEEEKRQRPVTIQKLRKTRMNMELYEILQKAESPLTPKEVWQLSRFKDNIDGFYNELKKEVKHLKRIKESKDKKHLLLVK